MEKLILHLLKQSPSKHLQKGGCFPNSRGRLSFRPAMTIMLKESFKLSYKSW